MSKIIEISILLNTNVCLFIINKMALDFSINVTFEVFAFLFIAKIVRLELTFSNDVVETFLQRIQA